MASRTMTAEARITAKDATGNVFNRLAAKIAKVDRQAKVANAAMARNTAASVARAERFSATSGLVGAAMARVLAPAAAAYGVAKLAGSALDLERTMIEVQKATNSSGDSLKAYEQTILNLARETGIAKEELGGIMAAAAFAGRPTQELARYTEYAAKATKAWGTNAAETGQYLAELGNIYGANQTRIEEIGDAINTAADISASREDDLLQFIRRAGASAKGAGLSAEETLAFGAALKEVGVRTDVAATGFEALLNVMKLGQEFSADAREGFIALGVDSTKMRKAFVAKPVETMVKLLERLSQVSDPLKKAEIMTNIFGKEYQDDISKLLNALPRLNTLLGVMGNKSNYIGSVGANFKTAIDTDVGRIARATQALDVLSVRAGTAFKLIAGGAAEEINKLVDSMEKGDSFFQRLQTEREAYNQARYGSKLSPEEQQEEQVREENFQMVKSWWEKLFGSTGGTASDARREGIRRAVADNMNEEDAVLARPGQTAEVAARRRDHLGKSRFDWERKSRGAALAEVEQRWALEQEDARRIQQGRAARAASYPALAVKAASNDRLNAMSPGSTGTEGQVGSGVVGFGFGPHGAGGAPGARLPLNAPLPPQRPVDVTGKVEADVTGTISTTHVVRVDASPDLIARITSMSANSTGPVRASAGTSMPHIANPAGR